MKGFQQTSIFLSPKHEVAKDKRVDDDENNEEDRKVGNVPKQCENDEKSNKHIQHHHKPTAIASGVHADPPNVTINQHKFSLFAAISLALFSERGIVQVPNEP
jgi:hypothetical protein